MITASAATSIPAFAAVAAILVLTPGVGTTFLLSTVLAHGRRAGYLTATGMVLGATIHATIAAVGTAALLHVFPRALSWIALVGGTFIIVLGLRGIVRALEGDGGSRAVEAMLRRPHGILMTGLLIALANAPLPLFYFVVVPQYIPPTMPRVGGAALLSTIHIAMAFTWMVTFVTLVGRLAEILRRPRVRLALQCVTGILLIVLGGRAVYGAWLEYGSVPT
jgi:threonine/homoserine/homoserine lactone efflux protein